MDRRTFLKFPGAILWLPLLDKPVATEPVIRRCVGTWRGLPVGWALQRVLHRRHGLLHRPLAGGRRDPDFLALHELRGKQISHAVGRCECADLDITLQNDFWWGAGREIVVERDGLRTGWSPPVDLFPDGHGFCDPCECQFGVYLAPGESSAATLYDPEGLERERRDGLARIERRKGLARRFGLIADAD